MSCNLRAFSSLTAKRRYTLKSPALAFLKLNMYAAHLLLSRLTPAEHPPSRDRGTVLIGQRRRRGQSTDRVRLKRCRGDHDPRLAVAQRDRDSVRMRRVGLRVWFAAPGDSRCRDKSGNHGDCIN